MLQMFLGKEVLVVTTIEAWHSAKLFYFGVILVLIFVTAFIRQRYIAPRRTLDALFGLAERIRSDRFAGARTIGRDIEGENEVTQPLHVDALQANASGDVSDRAKRLKEATHATHDRLDKSIMAHRPFESQARYGLFLKVQHQFHREIDALYANPVLDKLLPDLAGRRRLPLIEQDLADLRMTAPSSDTSPVFASNADADLPTALGWLYVAEGSNLGAAFLLKAAQEARPLRNFRRASSCCGARRDGAYIGRPSPPG